MNKQEYAEYLQSPHWLRLAEETKRLAGNRCQVCNSAEHLSAHHRTYARVGDELQGDLVCLCNNCHKKFHGKEEYEQEMPRSNIFVETVKHIFSPSPTILPEPVEYKYDDTLPPRLLTLSITSSGDKDRDKRRVKNSYGIIISYPGKDHFQFRIDNKLTEFPNDTTCIHPDMLNRLKKLIGNETWEIT